MGLSKLGTKDQPQQHIEDRFSMEQLGQLWQHNPMTL
jgi:hypothetical protein